MKAYQVIFQHGQFIDKETGKRIIPVQGKEFLIAADNDAFSTEDAKLKMDEPMNELEKSHWAEKKFGKNNYVKILNAGEQLFFRIGNSRKMQGDESNEYIFTCTLLEDLYLYLRKSGDRKVEQDWRLADCQCELEECLLGNLKHFEKIKAESLNRLFSQTVMFYFSMQRSSSANAFNTFFVYEKGMNITFYETKNMAYKSLGKLRLARAKMEAMKDLEVSVDGELKLFEQ